MALLPVALVALLVFAAALGVLLAAVNVYARDTEHLLELALLGWFWMTPIVYQYGLVAYGLGDNAWVYRLNPITPIVLTFQRAIYNRTCCAPLPGGSGPILPTGVGPAWYLGHLAVVGAVSAVLLLVALRVFGRLEGNFAEEL